MDSKDLGRVRLSQRQSGSDHKIHSRRSERSDQEKYLPLPLRSNQRFGMEKTKFEARKFTLESSNDNVTNVPSHRYLTGGTKNIGERRLKILKEKLAARKHIREQLVERTRAQAFNLTHGINSATSTSYFQTEKNKQKRINLNDSSANVRKKLVPVSCLKKNASSVTGKANAPNAKNERESLLPIMDGSNSCGQVDQEVESMEWESMTELEVVQASSQVRWEISQQEGNVKTSINYNATTTNNSNDRLIEKFVVIIDTNIFLQSCDVVNELLNLLLCNNQQVYIVVPWIVLSELDYIKDQKYDNCSLLQNARAAIHFINKMLTNHHCRFKCQSPTYQTSILSPTSNDDYIIDCCLVYARSQCQVILCTNDKNLINKAHACNFIAFPSKFIVNELKILYGEDSRKKRNFYTYIKCSDVLRQFFEYIIELALANDRKKINSLPIKQPWTYANTLTLLTQCKNELAAVPTSTNIFIVTLENIETKRLIDFESIDLKTFVKTVTSICRLLSIVSLEHQKSCQKCLEIVNSYIT